MLSDAVRRELDGLVDVALPSIQDESNRRVFDRLYETSNLYIDTYAIEQVPALYKERRFPTDEDGDAFIVRPHWNGDIRNAARGFVSNFYEEIRDIICNKKRQTAAANLTRRGIGPSCAGLAAYITSKFGLTEPIAIAVGTYLLIVLLEATKGAFCRMTKEDVGKALGGFDLQL